MLFPVIFFAVFWITLDDHIRGKFSKALILFYFYNLLNFLQIRAPFINKMLMTMHLFFLKEVDLIMFLFEQDLYNLKHMELTSAIWIDPLKLLQPWPNEQNRLEVTIRPFQSTVCFNLCLY